MQIVVATAACVSLVQTVAAAPETPAASAVTQSWIAAACRGQAFRRTNGRVGLEPIVWQQQRRRYGSQTTPGVLLLLLLSHRELLWSIVGTFVQQSIWFLMCCEWRPACIGIGSTIIYSSSSLVAGNELSRVACSQQLSRVACPKCAALGNTGFSPVIVGTKAFKGTNRVRRREFSREIFGRNERIRRRLLLDDGTRASEAPEGGLQRGRRKRRGNTGALHRLFRGSFGGSRGLHWHSRSSCSKRLLWWWLFVHPATSRD